MLGRIGGRECVANVWIDGFRGDMEQLRSVRPSEVVAVEWYPRGNFVPLRYQPPTFEHCGVRGHPASERGIAEQSEAQ